MRASDFAERPPGQIALQLQLVATKNRDVDVLMSTISFGNVRIEGPAAGNPPRSAERFEERAMTLE